MSDIEDADPAIENTEDMSAQKPESVAEDLSTQPAENTEAGEDTDQVEATQEEAVKDEPSSPHASQQGSPKDSPSGSVKGSPRDSVRGSVHGSAKGSASGSPNESPRGSAKGSARGSPKGLASGSPKDSPRGSVKGSVQGSPKGSTSGSPKDSPRGSVKGSVQGSPKGSVSGSPKGSVSGSPKGSPKGSAHGSAAGSPRDSQKGSTTHSPRGSAKGSPKESPKGSLKGSVAGSEKGSPRGSVSESPKPVIASDSVKGSAAGSMPGSARDSPKNDSTEQAAPDTNNLVDDATQQSPVPSAGEAQLSGQLTIDEVAAANSGLNTETPVEGTAPNTLPPDEPLGRSPGAPPSTADTRPPTPPGDSFGRTYGAAPPPDVNESQSPLQSQVPPAPPMPDEELSDYQQPETFPNALNLTWSFGMNKNVGVINMATDSRQAVAYTCAHTAIIYDHDNNKQMLLQGHTNAIKCLCVSPDKRWLATADVGPDHMMIVWDSYTGVPVRTIFEPHPDGGVVAMAMTPDAKFIATLSASETQTFAIWDWTVESDNPIATAELKSEYGVQRYIFFNPQDTSQIVTNSDNQVIFYEWRDEKIEYFAPPLTDEDFNKPVGVYSASIFQYNSTRALTATSYGNLVVWDTNKPLTKMVNNDPTPDKKALKLLRLQEKGISVLTVSDQFIVMADVNGHVKFFDQTLKLTNWYQDFHLGPITSLSFAADPEFIYEARPGSAYPPDATIRAKSFVVRDFVVGTSNALIASVTTDGTDVKVIHRDHDAAVHALAPHPSQHKLAVGGYSGLLKIWDYEEKKTVVSRTFDRLMIRCCTFDPNGDMIAVGFTNGTIRIVDATTLDDLQSDPFRYAREAITHLVFSHNCKYLAAADAEHTTTLFVRQFVEGHGPYAYMGRYRAHYKTIQEVLFGVELDSSQPRLMTLGEDRHLVEYNLESSGLSLLSSERIEQSAVPLCMQWYPAITKESFLLTANHQFKFKLYNSTTKMCRKTLLSPTYGSPIERMVVLPTEDEVNDKRYLAYITHDKIGLNILPLDGNPHNAMALMCHPGGVSHLVSSFDGKYIFTAGGPDLSVHMWNVNVSALEAQARLGGEDLIPFYGLMEGGRDGDIFRELEDYFYYAQIRSQGVNTMETRKIHTTINVPEIPYVMRALGFYPSEQEIDDMLNEVKYSNYVETGSYTTEIELGDFIKLYINHRPAFGLQPDNLQWAFEVLGIPTENGYSIDRGELLDLLQNSGEHMTEYELAENLTTLLGFNEEGGASELQDFDTSTAGTIIDQNLPHEVTAEMFANDLLSFGMYGDVLPIDDETEYVGIAQPV